MCKQVVPFLKLPTQEWNVCYTFGFSLSGFGLRTYFKPKRVNKNWSCIKRYTSGKPTFVSNSLYLLHQNVLWPYKKPILTSSVAIVCALFVIETFVTGFSHERILYVCLGNCFCRVCMVNVCIRFINWPFVAGFSHGRMLDVCIGTVFVMFLL